MGLVDHIVIGFGIVLPASPVTFAAANSVDFGLDEDRDSQTIEEISESIMTSADGNGPVFVASEIVTVIPTDELEDTPYFFSNAATVTDTALLDILPREEILDALPKGLRGSDLWPLLNRGPAGLWVFRFFA